MYKTRETFAQELGMCARTMIRKLEKVGYKIPPYELLSPQTQAEIKAALKII
jgi:hypothetical protein